MVLCSTKPYHTYFEHFLTLFSQLFVLETSIILPPSSLPLCPNPQLYCPTIRTSLRILHLPHHRIFFMDLPSMAPPQGSKTKIISSTTANSFKAAIFHTMAFKLSLGIHNDQITIPTKRSFIKVLYNVCKIKKNT